MKRQGTEEGWNYTKPRPTVTVVKHYIQFGSPRSWDKKVMDKTLWAKNFLTFYLYRQIPKEEPGR